MSIIIADASSGLDWDTPTKLLEVFAMVYIIFMRSGKLVPLLFIGTLNPQTYCSTIIWCQKLPTLVCRGSSVSYKLEPSQKISMEHCKSDASQIQPFVITFLLRFSYKASELTHSCCHKGVTCHRNT